MSIRSIQLTEELYSYLLENSLRDTDLLHRLREETATLEWGRMQIAPEQGQFMAMLARLIGARRAIEVGVFTGYSSLCVGAALPEDGYLLACDVSQEYTDIARRYWKEAGVEQKIDLKLAPAKETLQATLELKGAAGSFDYMFIDADKESYQDYYELGLELLRVGGLILVDNVLWGGAVLETEPEDDSTRAIKQFNQSLQSDKRVEISMLPMGDGITLIRKL